MNKTDTVSPAQLRQLKGREKWDLRKIKEVKLLVLSSTLSVKAFWFELEGELRKGTCADLSFTLKGNM